MSATPSTYKMLCSSSEEFGEGNYLECCLQVWHGRGGSISISYTIVKTAFMVGRRHFLQTDNRAVAQAFFDVYVCLFVV